MADSWPSTPDESEPEVKSSGGDAEIDEDEIDGYIISVPEPQKLRAMDKNTPRPASTPRSARKAKNKQSSEPVDVRDGPVTPKKKIGWFGWDARAHLKGEGSPSKTSK